MRTRSVGITALHCLLLLPLLLDAAWNELLCCDHGPEHRDIVVSALDSGLQIVPVEAAHEDDCLCCGICSQRVSLDPSKAADPAFRAAEARVTGSSTFFIKPRPASHLSRGPPSLLSLPTS